MWRNLLVTVVVALIAGAIGGWIGTRGALEEETQTLPLRQTVHEIVHGNLSLTDQQTKEIRRSKTAILIGARNCANRCHPQIANWPMR